MLADCIYIVVFYNSRCVNGCLYLVKRGPNNKPGKHYQHSGKNEPHRGICNPKVAVKDGKADTPYLAEALKSGKFDYKTLIEAPLYPDQMVFLIGTLFENKADLDDGECSVDFTDGSVIFNMNEKKALTITETLTAVTFIMNTINSKGYTLSTMGEAAKHFIANWESEKYRKSLAGGSKK